MTLTPLFFFGVTILIIGFLMLFFIERHKKSIGIVPEKKLYVPDNKKPTARQETVKKDERMLESENLGLRGLPDILTSENGVYIPVVAHTGETPNEPYLHHTMELMAYCLLITESMGKQPPGGIVRYPGKEFKVAYTFDAEESVKKLISEMKMHKEKGTKFDCEHKEHQVRSK